MPSDEPGVAKSEEQDGQIPEPLPPELVYDHGGNVETRWEAMSEGSYATPNDRFYVRNYGPIPKIDRVPYNEQGYLYKAVVAHPVVVGGWLSIFRSRRQPRIENY